MRQGLVKSSPASNAVTFVLSNMADIRVYKLDGLPGLKPCPCRGNHSEIDNRAVIFKVRCL